MLWAAGLGVAVAYLAVSFQYGTPGSVYLEEGYATQFMVIGGILGLLIGNVFSRFQKSWIIWISASISCILCARFLPEMFGGANSMNRSTMAAWFGLLGFSIVHAVFLPFRELMAGRDLNG